MQFHGESVGKSECHKFVSNLRSRHFASKNKKASKASHTQSSKKDRKYTPNTRILRYFPPILHTIHEHTLVKLHYLFYTQKKTNQYVYKIVPKVWSCRQQDLVVVNVKCLVQVSMVTEMAIANIILLLHITQSIIIKNTIIVYHHITHISLQLERHL
jgi:hypothetical protein